MLKLVEKKRLIELLSHKDGRVITTATSALARFYPGSGNVIGSLLKAIRSTKIDKLSLTVKFKYFMPTDDDVLEILRLLMGAQDKTDIDSELLQWHLTAALYEFPFPLLEKNASSFSFNEWLSEILETARERQEIMNLEPGILWEKLEQVCFDIGDEPIEIEEDDYAQLLVTALSKKGEPIKHKVVMYISQGAMENYHLIFYLVKLAGKLKLAETVPYLFTILAITDPADPINEWCIWSLGNIGTPDVVEKIKVLYPRCEEIRGYFADILKYIPYPYAEDMAIKLLKKEQDLETKTYLANALNSIFSIKSGQLILDLIRKRQYYPTLISLLDDLIPVYVYHGRTIPNLAELEKADKKFRKEFSKTDPLLQSMLRQSREYLEELGELDEKENADDRDRNMNVEESLAEIIKLPTRRSSSKKKNKKRKDK
jgi:hypothetical protein